VNRKQLQALAATRLKDAKALLARKRWAAAFYLAGYAVECGLKSCVLRHIHDTGAIFADRNYLRALADCWTHDLPKLVSLAGLEAEFGAARAANPALRSFWETVKGWRETARYGNATEAEARELYEAITNDPDGVYAWLRSRW
jgi:HEPN domain-containing protein